MKIKDLPKIERPREKLMKYGPTRLNNSELLAIILRTGTKDTNVVELSKKILTQISKHGFTEIAYEDLSHISGLGPAKACEIVACFELGKRLLKDKQTEILLSPQDVFDALKDIRDNKKEHFVIFYLDTRNQEIQREIISIGTLNASLVHPREVFEPAIRHLAAQIIITHNHPSGNPEPSQEDIEVTRKLAKAGELLGIEVIDHIIVTTKSYLSFKERNLI
jgi:DNA repair protein RadC